MSTKRLIIIAFEICFGVLSLTMTYILAVDFLGFGPSKIYSDKMTFWVTSIVPITILSFSLLVTIFLHKKQKKESLSSPGE